MHQGAPAQDRRGATSAVGDPGADLALEERPDHPEQALSQAEDEYRGPRARLYAEYERSLQAYNAVDFDDLILLPVQLFREHPEVLERWQNRIRYLLVDEYQDTNGAQYELVRQLVGVRGAFTVVGDDDQSIYAWRGARPENLAGCKQDYPEPAKSSCWSRTTAPAAASWARQQPDRQQPHVFEKRLWSDWAPASRPGHDLPRREPRGGAGGLGDPAPPLHAQGRRFGDFAILYRGNHQARLFEKALREHNIPYFPQRRHLFLRPHRGQGHHGLSAAAGQPGRRRRLSAHRQHPAAGDRPGTLEKLAGYARERGIACCGLRARWAGQQLAERPRTAAEFADWIRPMPAAATASPSPRSRLVSDGLRGWLQENASSRRWRSGAWRTCTT